MIPKNTDIWLTSSNILLLFNNFHRIKLLFELVLNECHVFVFSEKNQYDFSGLTKVIYFMNTLTNVLLIVVYVDFYYGDSIHKVSIVIVS